MADSLSPCSGRHSTRRLTWAYIVALSAVALLIIAGQIIVQRSLAVQRRSSTVVNIAGRQRMLSQQLAKTALLVAQSQDDAQRDKHTHELAAILQQWRQAHQGLQHGHEALQLPGRNSDAVQGLFAQLAPHYQAMLHGAEQVAAGQQVKEGIAQLLASESAFLAHMDAIVFQYDRETQADVARLQWQERCLLMILLAVLLAEAWLIFRPAVARMQSTMTQLIVARQAAEAANAEKSRFLARVSHELRTPLHAILGLTDLLLLPQSAVQDDISSRHLRTIRDAAEALLRLVDDLLDIARVEAGGILSIDWAPTRLHDVVQRALRLCGEAAARKSLQVTCNYDLAIPSLVLCDAGRLQQVLVNLLSNAIKFTDVGGVRVTAQMIKRDEQCCVVQLTVEDTGVGIPEPDRQRIFESFTQLENAGRAKQEGVGLGLNIVARLVAALGGQISVSSALDRGSAFTIQLPLEIAAEPLPSAPASPPQAPAKHVLVIEDTPGNQIVARELLTALGHRCVIAETAAAGLAAAAHELFDVVLLDLELPDASGFDVAHQLRALPGYADTPLIAVTAHVFEEYRARSVAVGLASFITKPIRLAQLAAVLGNAASGGSFPDLRRWQTRPELLQSLIRLFREERPKLLATMDAAIAQDDARQVQFFAHRVKGMTANFDDPQTQRLAGELEQVAERGDLIAAGPLHDALAAALTRLEHQLLAHVESLSKAT